MAETKKKIKEMGKVTVTRTMLKAGVEEKTHDKEEEIEITPFVTEPAKIAVSKGLTLNLGNYRSARIDVSVAIPCYVEEVGEVIEQVNNLVEARVIMERDSVLKAGKKDA